MAGFITIVINKRCKLESLLGAMVIRSEKRAFDTLTLKQTKTKQVKMRATPYFFVKKCLTYLS